MDVLSRIQLEELLLEFRPTIVFVEHDRVFCDRVATKAVTLLRLDVSGIAGYNIKKMQAR